MTRAVHLPNHWRRARVSRRSRAWRVRAAKDIVKVGGFTALRNFILPRVRTYHTREPSRFVHALSARPLKVQGGRGLSLCADGTTVLNLISLCLHPVPHPNLNREVRRSPTWHSSESESALERFEPVAVVQQLLDGRGSVFAPVAARRRKVFKRGIPSSFCPFRSFRTSEKNSEREET